MGGCERADFPFEAGWVGGVSVRSVMKVCLFS